MTKQELDKARYNKVVKANDLIRHSRFSLSTLEQKIVLFMISKIDSKANTMDEIEFSTQEFCEVCGIDYKSNVSTIKSIIQELADKSLWIKLTDRVTLIRWIEKPYIYPAESRIKIRLDKDLMPFLLDIKGSYTEYELIAVLALKSKYSLRLFELFKSYLFEGTYAPTVKELRESLCISEDEYSIFYDFRRYVVDTAIDEIERYTPLEISYTLERKGRKIHKIRFVIVENADYVEDYSGAQMFLEGKLPTRHKAKASRKKIRDGKDKSNDI